MTATREGEDNYRVPAVDSLGPLGTTPLLDTPYSIGILPEDLIKNSQAVDFKDVSKYLPLVAYQEQQGPDILRPQTRGLQGGNFQNSRLDGMTMFVTVANAMEQFQQIEVVNGVSASLYGPANPSGMFNFVSKRPTQEPLREISASYTSDSIGTLKADVGGRIDGNGIFTYRLNALYGRGDGYVDLSTQRRALGDLGIDIRPGQSGVLELNYSDYSLTDKGYPGWFTYGETIVLPPAPDAQRVGYGQSYAGIDLRTRIATARIKQDFGSSWHLVAGVLNQDASRNINTPADHLASGRQQHHRPALLVDRCAEQPHGHQYRKSAGASGSTAHPARHGERRLLKRRWRASPGGPEFRLSPRRARVRSARKSATLFECIYTFATPSSPVSSAAPSSAIRCSSCWPPSWSTARSAMPPEPLITWSQGQKARPTQFAERLLWAERRARTRMQPHIEALRSDLARVLADARDERHQLLSVRASHDLALPVLQQHVAASARLHLDIGFQGSVDALRALNDRQCLVAGFHVPVLRGAAPVFARALKPLLKPRLHQLIACSRRMQGFMVRKEHAARVRTFPDVFRQELRFVNRQSGSGTRLLVDHLVHEHSLAPRDGALEHVEHTHVAVALCVASGVADAGVGVEAAALQFGLHFIPLVEENYFLACLNSSVDHPAVRRLREVLAGAGWCQILANLPGYRPAPTPGALLVVEEALPWWRRAKSPARRGHLSPVE